jgi:hypothetical protein
MTKLILGKIIMEKPTMFKTAHEKSKYGQTNQWINILWLNQPMNKYFMVKPIIHKFIIIKINMNEIIMA